MASLWVARIGRSLSAAVTLLGAVMRARAVSVPSKLRAQHAPVRSAAARRRVVTVVAVLATAGAVAGCTSHASPAPSPSTTDRPTTVVVAPRSADVPDTPIHSGPTTVAAAPACPFLEEQSAADRVGMRLDAIAVLRSGGEVIGCRFYPLGHPTSQCDLACLNGEHLPPASQPAIEITRTRYASVAAARAALVSLGKAGTKPQPVQIGQGLGGVCFQTEFYPKDHGRDWACAFSKAAALVVVRTVATDSFTALEVAKGVAPKI